jgi:hypothetical protein
MTQIPNVAEETKEKIKRSSAYSLPNNPTGAGYKAQDIKNALFKPIVDGQYSVLAEVDKLIDALNSVLPQVIIREMKLMLAKDELVLQFQTDDGMISSTAPIELPYENKYTAASEIVTRLDKSDYTLTIDLKSASGTTLSSSSVNLPIESMIIGASYNNGIITLQLKNNEDGSIGNTIDVNISDLISGLVNETDFETFQDNVNGEIVDLQNDIIAINQYATENINNLQDRVSELEENSGGGGNITVEKEVNDSENPVSSVAVKNEFSRFVDYYDEKIERAVVIQKTFGDGEHFVVENNKDYHADDYIATLTIVIPDDNILCSLMFTTVDSGTVNITLDGVKGYIGKAPDLDENGVTWELSIHNGIIASGKVVSE